MTFPDIITCRCDWCRGTGRGDEPHYRCEDCGGTGIIAACEECECSESECQCGCEDCGETRENCTCGEEVDDEDEG